MKGQATLEFMFYISIFIFFLTVAFIFSSNMNIDSITLERKFEAENICRHFSVLISSVATSGNGTLVEYKLPPNIGGGNYAMKVNGSTISITIDYLKGAQTCLVQTANFTSATISSKEGTIRNTGEGVVIEQN